jgi:5-methylcytosine-specific restriction enzyme A
MAERRRLASLQPRVAVADLRVVKPAPKQADSFYLSPEWRALVAEIKDERGDRCEEPGCGRTHCRIFGDHIKELRDGGAPLDKANVMLRCGSCHGKKTAAARRARLEQMAG